MIPVVAGIDVGGTNTALGLVDRAGRCLAEEKISTADYPAVHDYVAAVADCLNRLLEALMTCP